MTSVKAAGDAAMLLETGPDDRWAGGLGVQDDNEAGNGPIAVGGTPASVAAAIRAAGLTGLIDVVPGARTVLVTFEPGSWAPLAELAQFCSVWPPSRAWMRPTMAVRVRTSASSTTGQTWPT